MTFCFSSVVCSQNKSWWLLEQWKDQKNTFLIHFRYSFCWPELFRLCINCIFCKSINHKKWTISLYIHFIVISVHYTCHIALYGDSCKWPNIFPLGETSAALDTMQTQNHKCAKTHLHQHDNKCAAFTKRVMHTAGTGALVGVRGF